MKDKVFKADDELANYLILNGYKELLGDDYLKYYEYKYNPKRRRLFYIPRLKSGNFSVGNWRYLVFDWGIIKDFKTQYDEMYITKDNLDKIIKIQNK